MAERPAWRCAGNFLVDCGPSERAIGGVPGFDEAAWREPHDFLLIDGRGETQQTFATTSWSVDEELGMSGYAVIGDALVKRSGSVFSNSGRVARSEEVVLDGLASIEQAEAGALASALERSRQKASARERSASLAADARIAAIPGALDDYAAGDAFRRAQELLCARVRDYGLAIDGAMLRVLVRFGRAYRSTAALAPALERVVIACRLAAFDHTLQPAEDSDARSSPLPEVEDELRELRSELDQVHGELLRMVESQEWVDANLNAAQFRAAAEQIALARHCLK